MFKLAVFVGLLSAIVTTVHAHGYVDQITSGGQTWTGYLPYSDPYSNPVPQRIVRKIPGNGPVEDLSLIDVQCNGYTAGGQAGSAPAPLVAKVTAGSKSH
ncbi:hypothetical protein PM082_021166 [Marasmius tenuissimus]|nr:hypothetical protein PM082_021166 [Marasmius tenuissimus]